MSCHGDQGKQTADFRCCFEWIKSPYLLYKCEWKHKPILRYTLLPFSRQHFGDNCCYQENNATPHHARVVLDFLQQGKVTKMEQPVRSRDCNPIKHIWDELGHAITSMNNSPQNPGELHQAALDEWPEIPAERPQRLVTSMSWRLAAIIGAGCGNTIYWPSIH